MLKIKDNVDLKELEKFGFSHLPAKEKWQYGEYEWLIEIYEKDRSILCGCFCCSDFPCLSNLDDMSEFLFSIIQAGLVEKVVD